MFAVFPIQKGHLAVLETKNGTRFKIPLQISGGNIKFYHAKTFPPLLSLETIKFP